MVSFLAWSQALLRALVCVVLFPVFVKAKTGTLFTSSVTYCSPPEALIIQRFSLIYFASNQSISFNISAASVVPGLRVKANILLNVYGMQPVNVTEDFCNAFGDALCPLPTYNFTGSSSLPLPSSINVASKVPSIAYKIPDLEAFAQLTLTDTKTGNVTACIQATLSNGWSARQPTVARVTGGFMIFALVSALLHSLLTLTPFASVAAYAALPSVAPTRVIDFALLLQQISMTGLLHVNLPLVYRAFTLNFAWSLGLFSESQSIQRAINRMRRLTGGNMKDDVHGTIAFLSRHLSPYNVPVPSGSSPASYFRQGVHSAIVIMNGTSSVGVRDATTDSSASAGPPATVTNSAADILPAGIPVYVNSLDIGTANAMMSVLFTVLFGAVVGAGILGILYMVLAFASTRLLKKGGSKWEWPSIRTELRWLAVSSGIRYSLLVLYPVLIFTFFQWTLDDSWLSILLSVFLLLSVAAAILYPAGRSMVLALQSTPQWLYTARPLLETFGALYGPFRPERYYFFLPFLAAALLKSVMISFVRVSGMAQVIGLLIVELALLVLLCVLRPYRTRGGDALGIYLALTRVAVAVLMFPFVQNFHVKAIPRVAVSFVIMAVFSVAVVVMALNIVFNFGAGLLWSRRNNKNNDDNDDRNNKTPFSSCGSLAADVEKGSALGGESSATLHSAVASRRPTNPTPSTSFSRDVSAHHSRHAPCMTAAISPNFTIPSFETSEGECSPRSLSRSSSFHTPPSSPLSTTTTTTQNHSPPPTSTTIIEPPYRNST